MHAVYVEKYLTMVGTHQKDREDKHLIVGAVDQHVPELSDQWRHIDHF